ncbi:MAG: LptE family protein [Bacteroidota bacterium]|mgnify:CR=1 FL=1
MKTSKILLSYIGVVLFLTGCGVYSFTGVAITAETISIKNFYNDADGGPPDMAQTFTNQLTDYFQRNTNLTQVEEKGELQIEGVVTNYRLTPVAPTATGTDDVGDAAALTRLTITVSVSYVNTTDENFSFENKTFSFFEDFDNELNITAIEADLLTRIFDQIILDIFNATVANW